MDCYYRLIYAVSHILHLILLLLDSDTHDVLYCVMYYFMVRKTKTCFIM